ncbi:MAG TPA: ATP synthase F1 subunit gamma [Bacteroidales bacterium]|nr:ATP synthase F1 subunit gamma [Bacteroidales bacterium]HRR93428.1 ATP synthase F1 subunit gamma [Bacteroidales bacterium]HRT88849.1 ATP synthase F1 subunit gamma [Bacteroidales bacterium]
MANLKAIRVRINSVRSTRQITSAMKMVAAAKLRKAQDKILRLRPYAGKLNQILVDLTKSLADSEDDNIYGRKSDPEKILIVIITSNRGLCGSFNTNVLRETRRIIAEDYNEQYRKGNLWFVAIGKKGHDFLRKQKLNILEEANDLVNQLSFDKCMPLAARIMESFTSGRFDRVRLIYNQFKNAAVQNLTNEAFLPVEPKQQEGKKAEGHTDYIYEPTKEDIIKDLIPRSLRIQFYKAILDSFVAEHGARMTAMHKATDNATDLIRELTLQYNKARQAAITNQILEVVTGAEALKG